MTHPAGRGARRQATLDIRRRKGTKRYTTDRLPFLHRFTQLPRPAREGYALADQLQEA